MKKLFVISLFLLSDLCATAQAQGLRGRVTDTATGETLEAAAVTLQRGAAGAPLAFCLTDREGQYTLPSLQGDSLTIAVSYLGYRKEWQQVKPGTTRYDFALYAEALTLKEVQIRPGRIYGRQDTIKFDLEQFASSSDVNVKDVLRKLPGVEVGESGKIRYNGKEISHFSVEGMDLTGGRYNLINNNLDARAVKEAQIIENYQPIQSLRDKVFTDDIALNLKLDPAVRSKWMFRLSVAAGWGDDFLRDAGISALQLGHRGQSLYGFHTDNTGTDLSEEQTELISAHSPTARLAGNQMPSFLNHSSIRSPLDRRRVLFNDTHTFSANKLYKPAEETNLRLQAGYTRDQTRQQRGSRDIWYSDNDTIALEEQRDYRLRTNQAYLDMLLEKNAAHYYLRENVSVQGQLGHEWSEIGGDTDIRQRLNTHHLQVENNLHLVRNREKTTSEFRSRLSYYQRPSTLRTEDFRQELDFRRLYTDNHYSFRRSNRYLTASYTVGMNAELFAARQEERYRENSYSLYLLPTFQRMAGQWRTTLSLPVQYQRYTHAPENALFFHPSLSLRYRFNHRWQFSGYATLTQAPGNIATLYPYTYYTDYRTAVMPRPERTRATTQYYSLYGEYKNTVRELFFHTTLSYTRSRHNLLPGQIISDGQILLTTLPETHHTDHKSLHSHLSKGIYDWNLTTSLGLTLSRSTGRQWNGEEILPYRYDQLLVQPKLQWMPARQMEVDYSGHLSYGGSRIGTDTRLDPLLHMIHRLQVSWNPGALRFLLAGESYLDEISAGRYLHTLLADFSVIYNWKRWRATASLRNLFDRKSYSYTTYTALQSCESWLSIRPREFLISLQRQF